MAIVEMKKVNLLAIRSDQQPVLRLLQRLSCSEIQTLTPEERETFHHQANAGDAGFEEVEKALPRIEWAIRELDKRSPAQKKGLLAGFASAKPQISKEQSEGVLARAADIWQTIEAAERCEKRMGDTHTRASRIAATIEQYHPWESMDIPLEQIDRPRSVRLMMGQISAKNWAEVLSGIDARALSAVAREISTERNTLNVLIFVHAGSVDALEELLKHMEFAPVRFTGLQGTVKQNIAALEGQLAQIEAEREEIAAQWRKLSVDLPDLKVLHDLYQAKHMRQQAESRFAETAQTFYMRAWVPAPNAEALVEQLRRVSPSCAVEVVDPQPDEKPPTLLRNGWFASQFEGVVSGFSLPDPKGLDPTFIMAPFFACFFGMMVSDAGYGLVMALLIPLVIHIVKPKGGGKKLMWVLALGGIFTIIWGALFNTWFGEGIQPILLNPMEQPLEMVGLCLGVGMVHLFAALGIGAYKNFKNHDPWAALFDQFSWLALIGGALFLALPSLLGASEVWGTIGKVLVIGGLVIILLFAGRDKPNFLKRITSGLGALYGVTGWLGDLLSYTRLFGMGLATGVVGMVINMLAGMIMGAGPIGIVLGVVVLVGGHAFNMTINVLGAYVHSCRLQYIEFFGKFYQDGGLPFKPLHGNTRYVDLSEVE